MESASQTHPQSVLVSLGSMGTEGQYWYLAIAGNVANQCAGLPRGSIGISGFLHRCNEACWFGQFLSGSLALAKNRHSYLVITINSLLYIVRRLSFRMTFKTVHIL